MSNDDMAPRRVCISDVAPCREQDCPSCAYRKGIEDTVARGIRALEGFRDQAITAERKDAYQNAINVLRELS